jgi:hypothetical protein
MAAKKAKVSKYRTDYKDTLTGQYISPKQAKKRPARAIGQKRLRKKEA